jgi:DNA-binding transcriptional MerR regulator
VPSHSIGALSRLSGVNIETIRYYERIELLSAPARASNGYRIYGHATAEQLGFIKRARELGFSIDEIRALLELAEHPGHPCAKADAMVRDRLQDVEDRMRDLRNMRDVLRQLKHCRSETASDCRVIQTLGQFPKPEAHGSPR